MVQPPRAGPERGRTGGNPVFPDGLTAENAEVRREGGIEDKQTTSNRQLTTGYAPASRGNRHPQASETNLLRNKIVADVEFAAHSGGNPDSLSPEGRANIPGTTCSPGRRRAGDISLESSEEVFTDSIKSEC